MDPWICIMEASAPLSLHLVLASRPCIFTLYPHWEELRCEKEMRDEEAKKAYLKDAHMLTFVEVNKVISKSLNSKDKYINRLCH